MPVLNVKDERAYNLASQIARATGHSLTRVVLDALEEYASKTRVRKVDWQSVREIVERVHAMPDLDARSPEEIIGFNDQGHFG